MKFLTEIIFLIIDYSNLRIVVSNNTKKSIKSIYTWSDKVD